MSELEFFLLPMSIRAIHRKMLDAYDHICKLGFDPKSSSLDARLSNLKNNPITINEAKDSILSYFEECAKYCEENNYTVPDLNDPKIMKQWMDASGFSDYACDSDATYARIYFLAEISKRTIRKLNNV
jgi:hypothetical protein